MHQSEAILVATWPQLNAKFIGAIDQLKEAVNNVHEQAALAYVIDGASKRKQIESDMLALVAINEDSCTRFPCYSQIPPSNSHFHGRASELEAIKLCIDPDDGKQGLLACAVYGLGGIGKTTLALQYAALSAVTSTYDAAFWIRGQTSADIRESFTHIAICLELPRANNTGDHDSNVLLVKAWLGKTSMFLPICQHYPLDGEPLY